MTILAYLDPGSFSETRVAISLQQAYVDLNLKPAECDGRVLSKLQISPDSPAVFWTPDENSQEFRILWLDDEVFRCQIDAGTCDFYIP